jgi:hypothetical protein
VGLAVLATIAIDRTHSLLGGAHGTTAAAALTSGYARAFTLDAVLGLIACAAAFIVPSLGPSLAAQSAPADSTSAQPASAQFDPAPAAQFDPASTAGTVSPEPA